MKADKQEIITEKYLFCGANNSFYPLSMKSDYEVAGSWPDSGVIVEADVFLEFSGNPEQGKVRGASADGRPAWIELPPKTKEECVFIADAEKANRLDAASKEIIIWQTKLLMGRKLTMEETSALNSWVDYIDSVNQVDTGLAPEINWPVQPT